MAATGSTINGQMAAKAAGKTSAPLTGAQNTLYSDAQSIAGTPYTPYTGQQVADLSANQVKAVNQANDETTNNEAKSYIDKAGQQADFIAGNGWSADTASKYMNPYTQDVTDVALKQENQAYQDQINRNGLGAASAGAFGGDRATLTNVGTTGQHLQAQGNIQAEGNANAYNSAVQTWQADNARAGQAAASYQASGGDITNMNASQIKDLLATGGADQAVQQMKLSTGYNNYLDKRNWATNSLAPLESAVGHTPTLAGVQPTNYASDLVGVGSALAGYLGSMNSSSSWAPINSQVESGSNSAMSSFEPQVNNQFADQPSAVNQNYDATSDYPSWATGDSGSIAGDDIIG